MARPRLLEALGPNGQLMVNLIPELALIIGEQPPAPDLPPQDAAEPVSDWCSGICWACSRGRSTRSRCSSTICSGSDSATLDLIEHLVTHPDVRHLLLIGAYRDNEVEPVAPAYAHARDDPRRRGEDAGDRASSLHAGRRGAADRRCAAYGACAHATPG